MIRYINKKIVDLSNDEIKIWNNIHKYNISNHSPFFSSSFSLSVAEALPSLCYVTLIMDKDKIVGFFPYQYKNKKLGEAGRIGLHLSDYNGIICQKNIKFSLKQLIRKSNINQYCFDHLHPEQKELCICNDFIKQGCVIDVSDGYEAYWKKLMLSKKKMIKDTKRRKKKIEKKFGNLIFCFNSGNIKDLEYCVALKKTQYKSTNVKDSLKDNWTIDVLKNLFSINAPHFKCFLSKITTSEGKIIAMHLGLWANDILHYWFPVYDSRYRNYAPGRLLLWEILYKSKENNIKLIDRGMGTQKYKMDFANRTYELGVGCWRNNSIISQYLRFRDFFNNFIFTKK